MTANHTWTPENIELLKALYPHTPTKEVARRIGTTINGVYNKVAILGLKKTAEFMASPESGRLYSGGTDGRIYRFPKGHVPANKGIKGVIHEACIPTQFKKGQKPRNWRPIGSERVSEGYLQRKLTDTGVSRRDYVCVHHIIWREAGFEIPDGYRLTFKDGNRNNIVLENLQLQSIADLMRRNTIHNYPKPIAELVHLRSVITRQINRKIKNEQ